MVPGVPATIFRQFFFTYDPIESLFGVARWGHLILRGGLSRNNFRDKEHHIFIKTQKTHGIAIGTIETLQ